MNRKVESSRSEYQSHSGAVDLPSTPAVKYTYAGPASGGNYDRIEAMTYPNGRVLDYGYTGDPKWGRDPISEAK